MASVFWDTKGLQLVDYLDYYADFLRQLHEKIKKIRCGKLTTGVLFRQDDAYAQKSIVVIMPKMSTPALFT